MSAEAEQVHELHADYRPVENLFLENEDGLIVIVSDFHIGEGFLRHKRVYSRTENFFYDDAFEQFLQFLVERGKQTQKRVTLIINGDFLDFIRIRTTPRGRENQLLQRYIRTVGAKIKEGEIPSEQEKTFGLGTQELRSVWKLQHIADGHPKIFRALAEFVVAGNRLILIKGNHDLEFYWPRVQREFHKILARTLPSFDGAYRHAVDRMNFIRKHVRFVQKAVIIDQTIYVEHGHQYQAITRVEGPPVQNGELSLPPGSILNRYLINAVEWFIPFVNNISPLSDVLRTLGFRQKLQALRIILRHLPTAGKVLLRRHRRNGIVLFLEILPHLLAGGYSIFGFLLPLLWEKYARFFFGFTGDVGRFLVRNWFLHLILIFVAFEIARWMLRFIGRTHHFDLSAALESARALTRPPRDPHQCRFLVLGHTHRPTVQRIAPDWWYVNSGTWVHLIFRRPALLPMKYTMTYVQFEQDSRGIWDFELMQWNEGLHRGQKLILLE